MANPQLKDGYTMIENEVLVHFMRTHLSANQWQVLLCIIRKTCGFRKQVDRIANFQIVEATGLGKTVVSRALHDLNDMQLISRQGKFIGFQKDWQRWRKLAEQSTKVSGTVNNKTVSSIANNEKLAISPTELAKLPTKVSSPVVTQKKKETLGKEKGENLLSTDQKDLFDILLKCPAIKENDAYKLPELLRDYPNIDYTREFKKFVEWWPGPRKRKKPWLVLRSWLEKAPKQQPELVDSGHYRDLSEVHDG